MGGWRGTLAALGFVAFGGGSGCYTGTDADANGGESATDSSPNSSASGNDGGGSDDSGGEPSDPVAPDVLSRIGDAGLRRLTAAEYRATVRDILGVDVEPALLLPEDWRQPFDNDYTTQNASQALIDGAELLASDVAALALQPGLHDQTVGCIPDDAADEACFREFLARVGRRALRRPLAADELDRYATLLGEAEETGEFDRAVEVALRAFLQHPEFLYRVELGTQVDNDPNVFRLGDFELATRMSYLLWGSTPSDALLDRTEEGRLRSAQDVRAAAEEMLLDDRARTRVGRFHSLWLGYEQLPHAPELTTAMQAETQALIERVIFDDALPWQELLRADDTFIDATLAEHYGLPTPSGEGWVDYGDTGRRGLLSHGTFLSAMGKIDDSSPTKRGILVRTRLMCMTIPPPPPNVDVDNTEPEEGSCKEDFYRDQHSQGSCVGCHALMDPIGLGLEQYDHTGAFRTVENDNPDCVISGQGDLDGTDFSGPAELSDLLIESGTLDRCVAEQLYRFAMGRSELSDMDEEFIDFVVDNTAPGGELDFAELMLSFVTDEAFRFRRNETTEGE